jgi:hypothetical protein
MEVVMRNRSCHVAVAIVLGLTAVLPARADELSSPGPSGFVGAEGQRLRLTVANNVRVEGTFLEADEARLKVLRRDGSVQWFDRADLSRVEIAERKSRLSGATRGALVGVAAGGLLGLAALSADLGATRSPDGQTCYDGFGNASPCVKASDIPAVLAGGALVGALIGAIWPGHHYATVAPGRIAVRVAPAARGVAVEAAVRF